MFQSVKILAEKQKIDGYVCRLGQADLRLETVDVKKILPVSSW
jgi:hypothetical protein